MSDPRPELVRHTNAGTIAYVIKNAAGQYWSLYGWSHPIGRAMRFPMKMDADNLIESDKNLAGATSVPHAFPDDVRDPHASTDYDPFHVRPGT